MKMNQQQKQIHNNNLLRIGAAAIRHAVKSVPLDNETSKLIDRSISTTLSGNVGSEIQEIEKSKNQSINNNVWTARLLWATEQLLRLANFKGYVSGNQVRSVLFTCWDAIYSDSKLNGLADGEQRWQDQNLEPLIEQSFHTPGVPLASTVLI